MDGEQIEGIFEQVQDGTVDVLERIAVALEDIARVLVLTYQATELRNGVPYSVLDRVMDAHDLTKYMAEVEP